MALGRKKAEELLLLKNCKFETFFYDCFSLSLIILYYLMHKSPTKRQYLPSKKFTIIVSIILGILLISWLIAGLISSQKTNSNLIDISDTQNGNKATIQDLVQKDSDGDKIPDWEEALWGTDPNNKTTHEGITDADWINKQKKELAIKSGIDAEVTPIEDMTETEKFSKEFFATISALRQSGNLDQGTVSNISNLLGDQITDVVLPDNYRVTDLKKTYDVSSDSQAKYYNSIKEIFSKYVELGLGDELNNVDTESIEVNVSELSKISETYLNFSLDALALSIPSNLSQIGLAILNSAYNTGIAVKNLAKMEQDPLVGLIGLSQYQKYSELFIRSSEDLRTYLINSDIIKG